MEPADTGAWTTSRGLLAEAAVDAKAFRRFPR